MRPAGTSVVHQALRKFHRNKRGDFNNSTYSEFFLSIASKRTVVSPMSFLNAILVSARATVAADCKASIKEISNAVMSGGHAIRVEPSGPILIVFSVSS